MRQVSPVKNRDGLFELGPCDGAYALGDTLTLTPLASALGSKAIMLIPPKMAHFEFLFRNLCQTKITTDFPIFPWKRGQAAKQKLDMYGLGSVSPIPVVKLDPAVIKKGREFVARIASPLAFVPTCSKGWEHIRQRQPLFWKEIVKKLSARFTVCQFGRKEYPTVDGAKRMPWVDLETLAGIYHHIGNYVGVNTGDYHLMLAVGGRCVVADSDPMPDYQAMLWEYHTPRVSYAKLSNPKTVLEAIERLPL